MKRWFSRQWKLVSVLLLFLSVIILFDVGQQYYYLTTFQILAPGSQVIVWDLVLSHFIKWILWVVHIPLLIVLLKKSKTLDQLGSLKGMVRMFIITAVTILFLVSMVSLTLSLDQPDDITVELYIEVWRFVFFQKFTSYFLGYLLITYYLYHRRSLEKMEGRVTMMKDLKESYRELYEDLKEQSIQEETSVLHVKVGNRIKSIPVPEIEWVQSEDYCVRIHSSQGEYVLRKSMKAMEKQLPHNFVRVHRQAIINMEYLDEVYLNGRNVVKLKGGATVPIAKSRMSAVKDKMKAS